MTTSSSSNIKVPDRNNRDPVLKKLIRIGSVVVVPIPEPLLNELNIDEECTWFEEVRTIEGILLKVSRCSAIPRGVESGRRI
jgi:hypothetical protein